MMRDLHGKGRGPHHGNGRRRRSDQHGMMEGMSLKSSGWNLKSLGWKMESQW